MPAAGFPAPCRAHADSMPAMLLRCEDPTARRELHQVRPSDRVRVGMTGISRICSRYCVQCLAFIGSVTYAKLLHINLTPCWLLDSGSNRSISGPNSSYVLRVSERVEGRSRFGI